MEPENSFKKTTTKRPFHYGPLLLLIALGLVMIAAAVLVTNDDGQRDISSGINLPADWVFSVTDTGESYSYPPRLETKYISSRDWSPTLIVLNAPYSCNPVGNESSPGIWKAEKTIDGRSYCVSTYSEGAAGTIYKNYSYYFPLAGQTGVISFFLGYPQCVNYDDPEKTACEKEQADFNLDALVEEIVKTITLSQTTIKDRLAVCLVASDWGSHDYCQALLDGIRNYDDCVAAGLKVDETNPNLCLTPDNRSFVNEANSTWPILLEAINNCEVEEAFQSHQEFVELTLKDGTKLSAYEPNIDDIFDAVDATNGKCGEIRLATE
ncbi:MAG: hypothetical protein JST_000490 [Candidatus Parcubacteria bacterium]|nr:MAG: hypothetical protein JST_4570 [Candidatus Parcubacteria bacterium]